MLTKREALFTQTRIDDEIVVMLLASGEFLSITGTGADIWERIDGTRDRATLVAELADEYDASEAEISADVDAFLTGLKEAGIVAGS